MKNKGRKVKDITIILAGFALGIGVGFALCNSFKTFESPKKTPDYVGMYHTDYWNGNKAGGTLILKEDKTCEHPSGDLWDMPCTFTVDEEAKKISFYNSEYMTAYYSEDGIVYGNYYFKRLK